MPGTRLSACCHMLKNSAPSCCRPLLYSGIAVRTARQKFRGETTNPLLVGAPPPAPVVCMLWEQSLCLVPQLRGCGFGRRRHLVRRLATRRAGLHDRVDVTCAPEVRQPYPLTPLRGVLCVVRRLAACLLLPGTFLLARHGYI